MTTDVVIQSDNCQCGLFHCDSQRQSDCAYGRWQETFVNHLY